MPTPTTTTLGTPCSLKWTPEWRDRIDHDEQQLNRRICGAHTPACTPCKLGSTHPNGRCRFHGGHPDIGAPLGNRNAVIHGLYSRRLKQCGIHCPLWTTCPMAGPDVLDLEPQERPACVYEQQDYDQTLAEITARMTRDEADDSDDGYAWSMFGNDEDETDAEEKLPLTEPRAGRSPAHPREDSGWQSHTSDSAAAHNVALLQTMLNRAAATLTLQSLTDQTEASTDTYQMKSTKISAILNAFLKIARELRAWLRYIPGVLPTATSKTKTPTPRPMMGLADYAKPILERAEGVLEDALEYQNNLDAQPEGP